MDPPRADRVDEICAAALVLASPEREAFVAAACAGDDWLRHEVESLLQHQTRADGFLAEPAILVAARGLAAAAGPALIGRQLGAYHVQSLLGAGGMGEVYRARDHALGRDVALKILPSHFTTDPDRVARFEREARFLAALNHPHIGAIYGLQAVDGRPALVLELVEGPTLAERIAQGPMPVADALTLAVQIAEALDAAHERGIVHRDLKPANVKLTAGGVVKVLDFGIAKLDARDPGGAGTVSGHRPTPVSGTRDGIILGTAAYMSPEQARGDVIDKRADIWAFGCVLFEMLTGRQPFAGTTPTDTLAAILEREPPWATLPDAVPAGARRLLRRCLEKDPRRRLRDIGDARLEIEEGRDNAGRANVVPPLASGVLSRRGALSAAALVAVAGIAAFSLGLWSRATPAPPEARVDVIVPTNWDLSVAISPDGQTLAFLAHVDARPRLWLRSLATGAAFPLNGTAGAMFPFWSPDGRSVGFFAGDELKRIEVASGAVRVVADAQNAVGGAWSPNGTIVFGMGTGAPIFRVPDTGGELVAVTPVARSGLTVFPVFLPDGRHFLFRRQLGPDEGIWVGQIDGGAPRRLLSADSPAAYAPSGHLLFIRQDTLFAQAFDPDRLELQGNAFPVAGGATNSRVSVSNTGTITYRTASAEAGERQLTWFDRSGRELETVSDHALRGRVNAELSPDGRTVAMWRIVLGQSDIWLLDLRRHVSTRLTSDPVFANNPVWSPDGTRIAFSSYRAQQFDLYATAAGGSGRDELLLETELVKSPSDWSRDGRFLLYWTSDPKTRTDIWALPMDGDRKPFPIVTTEFDELMAQFSPDGKWIAFQSDRGGRSEIYMQAFPGPGPQSQISTGGGAQVRWRQDGKELFYLAPDGQLMSVPIQLAPNAQTIEASTPVPLFLTRVFAVEGINVRQKYMVSADGQRFLVDSLIKPVESSIRVIMNWKPAPQSAP